MIIIMYPPVGHTGLLGRVIGRWRNDVRVSRIAQVPVTYPHVRACCQEERVAISDPQM